MNEDDPSRDSSTGSGPRPPAPEPAVADATPHSPDSTRSDTAHSTPDYEIIRRIGHGAYGEVYLARDSSGAYRAVKVIFRESFEHERPFEREYEGICKFERVSRSYDNQVQVFHVGRREEPRQFYYIMELADDQKTGQEINPETYVPKTLRSELKSRGRLPVKECISIGLALTRALENLHDSGLIHRDIKPANIIFVNRRPKLADIGLVTDRDVSVSFVGTEGFIPPEGPSSAQADIYSLGKVLYEMCTGRDRMEYPELPTNLADLPDRELFLELNEVIRKACQNDPGERYQSAARLRADLERLYRGQSLRKRRRLKRQVVTIGLAAGLVSLIAGAVTRWQAIRPDREATDIVNPRAVPAPEGLIAWWPADGNANDIVGNHHGESQNGADYAPGLIGQAFRVNGTNQYFSIPHSPSLSFRKGDQYTLEAWVYRTGTRLPFHVLGKRDTAFGSFYQMAFDSPVDPPPPPVGQWIHVVITDDGTTSMGFYNGALASTSRASSAGPNSGDFHIGSSYFYFGFEGLIDDVRVYNRALTQPEIRAIYGAGANGMARPRAKSSETTNLGKPGAVPAPAGLIAWWPGDADALDYAGAHNGTLVKGTEFGMGKVGQAFELNRYGAHVQVPNSPLWSFGSNEFTIELWAKFGSTSGGQTLVACDDGPGTRNKWILWFTGRGIKLHVVRAHMDNSDIGFSSFAPTLNQWYHLAVTRRSSEFVFLINGTVVSTRANGQVMPTVSAPLTVGAAEGGNFLNGSIDDVRIYNRALNVSEVRAIYDAGSNGMRFPDIKNFPARSAQ